jgi:MinD superfamily P-loop ATPase
MTNQGIKIAVASGKGGTGKTFVAVNLASLLSETTKTLLVDLDVEEPNAALFIDGTEGQVYEKQRLIPQWDEKKCIICDICSNTCKYHAVVRLGDVIAVFDKLCHSCHACSELCPQSALPMTKHNIGTVRQIYYGRLKLVEGRLNTGEEQAVPLINQVHAMIGCEIEPAPVVIFDCPPGTSCPVVAAVKKCDYVILVTEPTPFGLNDLKIAHETVRQLGIPSGVVINRNGIGDNAVEDWCNDNNTKILAHIPYDKEIAIRTSEGELVYNHIDYMKPLLNEIYESVKKRLQ